MAALFNSATARAVASREPFSRSGAAWESGPPDPGAISAGLAYVSRCLRGHRPFGIISGSRPGLQALLERVAGECLAREDLHTARIRVPTDSVEVFLTAVLGELGFELQQSAQDDLHKLLVVFLRHESARGRRTVAIIEGTDQFGPHVLECMQKLSRLRAGATPAITFILAGSPDLNRILDSRGMAGLHQFTRERYDLDRSLAWIAQRSKPTVATLAARTAVNSSDGAPVPESLPDRALLVIQDGAIVGRHALPLGRL